VLNGTTAEAEHQLYFLFVNSTGPVGSFAAPDALKVYPKACDRKAAASSYFNGR
jgi:hypothetical protein